MQVFPDHYAQESVSQKDISALREEIEKQDKLMLGGVFLALALMVVSFIFAALSENILLYKLVGALAVSMVFWVARGDYMIHRAVAYIRLIQEHQQEQVGWEKAKFELRSTKLVLPIDLLSATGIFWMLRQCAAALLQAGEVRFVYLCCAGVVAGIIAIVAMVILAQKRW